MNEQKCHLTPVFSPEPLPEEVEQAHGVGGQARDEHDDVGDDGHNLGLPEHHVLGQCEVILHHSYPLEEEKCGLFKYL